MARLETMEEVRLVCDAAEALCPANARPHAQSGPSATRPAPAGAGRRGSATAHATSLVRLALQAPSRTSAHGSALAELRRARSEPAVRPCSRGGVRLGLVGPAGA